MAAVSIPQLKRQDCNIAVIGDEDTVTGFLLGGIGNIDASKNSNFFIVTNKTPVEKIEEAFKRFTTSPEIAIVLITQSCAEQIRVHLDEYSKLVPTILEIPTKDNPYDPEKDSVMIRLKKMTGRN